MAKFGQGFLRAATQPSFGEGLFTVGQQIGMAPGMKRQREALSKINTGTPEGLGQLAQSYESKWNMENAVKYQKAARNLQTQNEEQAE